MANDKLSQVLVVWARAAALVAGCLLGATAAAVPVVPPDLSPLLDFGSSEIERETALIRQVGDKNQASVDQQVDVAGQTGHYVQIAQIGDSNQVLISQMGDLNRIRVQQDGSDNYAKITQTGARNSVDLSQSGSSNRFEATQIGNDNVIIDLQPGGSVALLEQNGNNLSIVLNQSLDRDGSPIAIRLPVQIKQEGSGLRVKLN